MKKRTRAEYTKRIDKVFSNWKGYTHEAEYLERLANPSLEKWNFIQLDTVAHMESYVCQLQFWHNPSPELFQRMVDALHIQDTLYIFQRESWKRPGFSLFQIKALIRCIASPKKEGRVYVYVSK